MPVPFRTTNVCPDTAVLVYSFDLKKNKAALWVMNLATLPLLFIFGWLFLSYLQLVRPGIMTVIFSLPFNAIYFVVSLVVIFTVLILIHELVHGIFFWIFTHQRPSFGLRGWYAFASAPGWYFPRQQYLVIGMAPFVVISVLGMILLAFLPAEAIILTLFAVTLNAASSVGDLWVCLRLIFQRGPIAVEDLGDGMYFYALG